MNLLDLLIVYLACGTPFAVYRFALSQYGAAETVIISSRAALLWPLDGGRAVVRRLRSASRSLSKPRLEVIRCEMEELLAQDGPHLARFAFREVFDRYSGLARVLSSPAEISISAAIPIAGADLTPAGKACLRRMAAARIERHTASARRELIEYIAACSSHRIVELAAALAAEVSDRSLGTEMSRRHNQSKKIISARIARLSGSAS